MRLVSWNINQLALWDQLAVDGAELALLQEAPEPPSGAAHTSPDWPQEILPGPGEMWATAGWEQRPWRTAIARLSSSFTLKPVPSGGIDADSGTLRVSRSGTLTAATIVVRGKELFTAVSVYSPWERPLDAMTPIWADGSAHRLLSDISPLTWRRGLPLIVSGDWNILLGYGEDGAATTGTDTRPSSTGPRPSACGSLGPSTHADAKPTPGRASCRKKVDACPPTITVGKRPRPRHGSWTSFSPRNPLPAVSVPRRSMTPEIGG